MGTVRRAGNSFSDRQLAKKNNTHHGDTRHGGQAPALRKITSWFHKCSTY